MISPKTWFLNADRTKVVPEGDKTAQFLLVREGQEISDALVDKYGLNISAKDEQEAVKEEPKKKHK